jgi:hypothetical protein
MGRPANAYLGIFLGVRLIYQCDIITQHGGRPMTVLVAPPQTISFSRECRWAPMTKRFRALAYTYASNTFPTELPSIFIISKVASMPCSAKWLTSAVPDTNSAGVLLSVAAILLHDTQSRSPRQEKPADPHHLKARLVGSGRLVEVCVKAKDASAGRSPSIVSCLWPRCAHKQTICSTTGNRAGSSD